MGKVSIAHHIHDDLSKYRGTSLSSTHSVRWYRLFSQRTHLSLCVSCQQQISSVFLSS